MKGLIYALLALIALMGEIGCAVLLVLSMNALLWLGVFGFGALGAVSLMKLFHYLDTVLENENL